MNDTTLSEEKNALRLRRSALHTPRKPTLESIQIELRDDGEQRFRDAVRAAAKSGPKHRPSKA